MTQSVTGAISMSRYVDITSAVGGNADLPTRQLIGRLMTDNPLVPPQTYIEFQNAAAVGDYFGFSSNEYNRAEFYFSWISKNGTSPQNISFGRWVDTAQAGVIYGIQGTYTLATFTAVTSGHLNLTIGATTFELTGINLSSAGNLAAVATDIQTAIQAHSAGGTDWTGATVTYNASAPAGAQFNLVGGVAGVEAIAVRAATGGTDLAPLLGWTGVGVIIGQGSAVETITQTLTTTASLSNNFGSFLFMPSLSTLQITQAAVWSNGQNVLYNYMVPVTASNASAVSVAIAPYAGCTMTLAPVSGEYPEMIPMTVLAATDFSAVNGVQGYMFQLNFPCTPSITNDTIANQYDALKVNYYGQTMNAGQFIQFYQRGIMTGGTTSPTDINTYSNEQWLKASMSATLMNLLLAVSEVPANTAGQAQLLAIIQSVIQTAITNGTISVLGPNVPLSAIQKQYITQQTGDPTAWQQVQTIGYWVDCVIEPYVNATTGLTEWKAVYTLIYTKNNQIRFVSGTDILI